MSIRNRNYYKTDNFETFIETFYFSKPISGSALKIKFLDSRDGGIIALREINIQYDRSQELETIENIAKNSNSFR